MLPSQVLYHLSYTPDRRGRTRTGNHSFTRRSNSILTASKVIKFKVGGESRSGTWNVLAERAGGFRTRKPGTMKPLLYH